MIHAVTPYGRTGPSSRVRVFGWLDRTSAPHEVSSYLSHHNASASYLARHPVAVLGAERRLRRLAASRPELLLLHREASPFSRGGLERRLLASAETTVYDFDDALQWDQDQGGRLRKVAPKAPKVLASVQRADRVIAGSPVLADWASQHNNDVVVIPSCVSTDSYRLKTEYEVRDPPTLGWIGSADNELYLRLVAPALHEIHWRTGARLLLIGTTTRRLGDLETFVDRVPWSEHVQHQRLSELDLGLMPLPDEPYTRGKSGYKLLQYAAAGVPAIGSPIGINESLLSQLRMPAALGTDEWVDSIIDLLTRPTAAREALGRHVRDVAERHYSYNAWLSRWEEAVGVGSRAQKRNRGE
ncbi:MAG: glycosyltransferase [Actinomycetota bacterium]|nr:glycosyltransferase [Actinomycetota bacterium]